MRTTLNTLAVAFLLCFIGISGLRAQGNTSIEAGGSAQAQYLLDTERQKIQLDKDLAADQLNANKEIIEKKYDAQRLMVHDIAWNSWVIVVIAIFYLGNIKNKRRHETIRLMIEKGVPLTPELIGGLQQKNRSRFTIRTAYDPYGYLCWGVTLTAIGLGILAVAGKPGWIISAIGVANLILWCIDRMLSKNSGEPK